MNFYYLDEVEVVHGFFLGVKGTVLDQRTVKSGTCFGTEYEIETAARKCWVNGGNLRMTRIKIRSRSTGTTGRA